MLTPDLRRFMCATYECRQCLDAADATSLSRGHLSSIALRL